MVVVELELHIARMDGNKWEGLKGKVLTLVDVLTHEGGDGGDRPHGVIR